MTNWELSLNGREWRLFALDRLHMASAWANGAWHTWDIDGVGGENGRSHSLEAAKLEAEAEAMQMQCWQWLRDALADAFAAGHAQGYAAALCEAEEDRIARENQADRDFAARMVASWGKRDRRGRLI